MSALLLAVGERVRTLLRIGCPRAVRPAAAFALGSLVIGVAALGAGLAGGFRPLPLLLLMALAAAAGRWSFLADCGRQVRWPGLAAIPLLPAAIAPPFFYDSWVYHLGLPWQALLDGSLRGHPGNLFSTFPPLAQLIYAFPLAAGATRAAGCVHLVGSVTGAAAVAFIARRLGARHAPAMLACVCVLYLPTAILVASFPAAEAWSLAAIVAALALALAGRPAAAAGAGAGLLAGVAAAARLQGVAWVGVIGLVLALRLGGRAPRPLGLAMLGALVGSAPWWLKNGVLLGDPLAPIGWSRDGVETLWRDAQSHLQLAAGAVDLLRRMADALSGAAFLVVPLLTVGAIGLMLRRRRPVLLVLLAGVLGLMAWSATGALGRFLTPCLALMLAAAAASARTRLGSGVVAAMLSVLLLFGAAATWSMYRQLGGLSVMGDPETVYAATVMSDPYPAFQACRRLPAQARLLLVSEPRGFLLPRPFETTSQHDPSALTALLERHPVAEQAAADLRQQGYTHLLINVAEMRRLGDDYPVLPWRGPGRDGRDRFVRLTQSLGEPEILEGDVVVYSLARSPSEGDAVGQPHVLEVDP